MFEKLIRIFHKENSIPLEQITKDFNDVVLSMASEFSKIKKDYCCHEMAYFINHGMKEKGYNSKAVDGTTSYGPACIHSWVEVQGNKRNHLDKYVLNAIWHPYASVFNMPVSKKIFTKDYTNKHKLFKKCKIYYDLDKDFKKLTDDYFKT